jgi:hypothetical protein
MREGTEQEELGIERSNVQAPSFNLIQPLVLMADDRGAPQSRQRPFCVRPEGPHIGEGQERESSHRGSVDGKAFPTASVNLLRG